jgi:hypothetical protein
MSDPGEAEPDLREAFRLCRDLSERALISWTAAELSRILVAKGEAAGARQVLDDPASRLAAAEPGSVASMLAAETVLSLAEGDRETALAKAILALEQERLQGWPNQVAAQVWWIGRLFGPDPAGGVDEVERARRLLEEVHWVQALKEPELVPETT